MIFFYQQDEQENLMMEGGETYELGRLVLGMGKTLVTLIRNLYNNQYDNIIWIFRIDYFFSFDIIKTLI